MPDGTFSPCSASVGRDDTAGLRVASLGAGEAVGKNVFLGLPMSGGPGRALGAASSITANSCASADVPQGRLVHGVPGAVGPLLTLLD